MLVKKNKGFSLIEIVVSLFILSIILTAFMSSETLALNFKVRQAKVDKAIMVMGTTSKIIIKNLTYDEVLSFFGNNVRYVKSSSIDTGSFKYNNIISISSSVSGGKYPFLRISALKDNFDDVIKITLNYILSDNEGDNLVYVFYKGKY
ncbi:prepilin-type N-terminal cleavage/methylation domain-containing protein [Clostridium sp.]|uniref:type IV pilus modification PilV family protein n=1 Tax=Clostridium sp. TaxID=1506 RepID=UPI002FC8E46F